MASANDQVTGADPQLSNDTIENLTIPQKDTSGIMMQSRNYSCGPAALATVLQNLGINSTEQELMVLAGTDTTGTSMHGLAQAAQSKGLNAAGIKLAVDELKRNHIVHIILDGEGHYSVIREITNESVYLADPSLGNIVMTREEFSEIYTGNALVITDPNVQVNQTAEQANNTDTNAVQPENLTTEMMQSIKGRWWKEFEEWGRHAWGEISKEIDKAIKSRGISIWGNHTTIQNATGNYTSTNFGLTARAATKQKRAKQKRAKRR